MARRFEPDGELSEICTKLWDLDENRCIPGDDYEIDLQGYVTSTRNVSRDWAKYPLFTYFNDEKIFEKETYKAFRRLLDNYEMEAGLPEKVTDEEYKEMCRFIDILMDTAVMQEAHSFLVSKNEAPEDVNEFKQLLYKLWFKLYRRTRGDRDYDSSGFEHVFVGESRGHDVIGFHNWIQFYLQEKRGNVDYRGYFRRGTSEEWEEQPRLITLQFKWKKQGVKPIGSSFIGTSPEFEMALYTLIHLMDKDKVQLQISDYQVEITCHSMARGCIGTAFPMAVE